MKCKAFDQILKELNERPAKLEKWLEDHRLTGLEKKILIGHSWIRNNLNQKVLDEIPLLAPSELSFIEAHRALLIGIASNNLSHFDQARAQLQNATKIFADLDLHYYHFLARFNLFIIASNQGQIGEMEEHLKVMRALPLEGDLQKYRLTRSEFIFADETEENELAWNWLLEVDRIKANLPESDRISHLVSEFMFLVRQSELMKAKAVLEQMKVHRKFQLSENYNYMKKLLDHLTEDTPIYAYATDFQEVPLLYHQLQFIQSLQAAEIEVAKGHWESLKAISPAHYGEAFEYLGSQCLFSLALKKHFAHEGPSTPSLEAPETKLEQLISVLETNPAGLKKAHLYELLWGETPETKDDLKRLARLVYKARQKHQIEIKTRKGCYYLELQKKKIAV